MGNSILNSKNNNGIIMQNVVNNNPAVSMLSIKSIDELQITMNSIASAIDMIPLGLPEGFGTREILEKGKAYIETIPLNNEAIIKYPPNVKGTIDIKVPNGKTLKDVIEDAILNDKEIPASNVKAIKYIGDVIDPNQKKFQERVKNSSFAIKPHLVPEARKKVKVSILDTDSNYETFLYPDGAKDNILTFTNKFEKDDCLLILAFNTVDKSVNITYSFKPSSWENLRIYKKFISNAILGRKLQIDLIDDHAKLIESDIPQVLLDINKNDIEDDISLYSRIINIERQYGIKFDVVESISQEEIYWIERINKGIAGIYDEGTWNKLDAKAKVKMFPKEMLNTEFRFDFIKHCTLNILNKTLNIKIKESYLSAKFDRATIDESKLGVGDELEISLLPGKHGNKMRRIIVF